MVNKTLPIKHKIDRTTRTPIMARELPPYSFVLIRWTSSNEQLFLTDRQLSTHTNNEQLSLYFCVLRFVDQWGRVVRYLCVLRVVDQWGRIVRYFCVLRVVDQWGRIVRYLCVLRVVDQWGRGCIISVLLSNKDKILIKWNVCSKKKFSLEGKIYQKVCLMLLISFVSTFIEFVSPLEKQIDISRLLLNGKNTILLNHNCISFLM
jgi:hypothetical protein